MLQVTVSSTWSFFEVTSVAAALALRLEARSPLAFWFGTFDIVQVVQTIGMELPFALAFLNFLSLPLENSVTEKLGITFSMQKILCNKTLMTYVIGDRKKR